MIRSLEQRFWQFVNILSPRAREILFKRRLALAYIVAGGSAATVDIGTLYLFKGILGFTIIPAVAVAFFAGFCVSFIFQKFWTFEDTSMDKVHAQATLYFIVSTFNFFLNIALMYFLVAVLQVWYIFAKILVSGGIAFITFFIYRIFIFKRSP